MATDREPPGGDALTWEKCDARDWPITSPNV